MNDSALYAVFGHPISHSLSPRIHRAFAKQFDFAVDYRAIDVPGNFAQAATAFFAAGGVGANITLPHKAAAFELADEASPAATRAGVANVLTQLPDGRLSAHNTDGAGLVRDLAERHRVDLRGHTALLLGAGGAARAAAWALLDAGVDTLTIVNRGPASADALADAIGEPERAHTRYWEHLDKIGSFDLIVNATSAGVLGKQLDLPFALVGNRGTCYDLSYGPAATGFLVWARAAGARYAFDGLGMLIETAAVAFEIWHGKRPSTDEVYRTLRQEA